MSDDGEDNITSLEQRASGRARPLPQGRPGVVPVEGYHAPRHLVSRMAMPVGGGEAACQPVVRLRREGWSVGLSRAR